jgi:uncharacterized protein YbjT (DUF2867 family)
MANGKTIFVTGATGKQGSAAVRHILEAGYQVRGLTREPNKPVAKVLENLGAEIVEGNLDDPGQIRRDIDGCYGVFAVLTWREEGPQGEISQGRNLTDAAKDAGIEHFVYSSVGGAERNTGIPHFDSKWKNEQYMQQAGLPLTVLRPVTFMENYNATLNCKSIRNGKLVYGLGPSKPLQLISVEDIGFIGALALDNKEDWLGRSMEIAGDSLTMPQVAERFSGHLGRKVEFVEQPLQELKKINKEGFAMLQWMNDAGYQADIDALRRIHPSLMNLEQWLKKGYWRGSAEKQRIPQPA